jgi:hypothetical protein
MAKLKIAHKVNGNLLDQKVRPLLDDGVTQVGGTGGQGQSITSTGVKTIAVTYNTTANAQVTTGYIIAQKGIRKFRVANAAAVGTSIDTVTLVNKAAGALGPDEARIVCYNTSNTAFNASRITNKFVYDFSGNRYRYVLAPAVATATFANVASN